MENGNPSLETLPRFLLPNPAACPMPRPSPMQPMMIKPLTNFHFTPSAPTMANAEPKISAANQIVGWFPQSKGRRQNLRGYARFRTLDAHLRRAPAMGSE